MMSERYLWDRFLFQIRESGHIREGWKILDVGTGQNTTVLEIFGDRWVVTPSDVNVGEWNAHILGMIELDIMNPPNLLVSIPKYDVIVLSEVLEHVIDPAKALENAWKMLKLGGIVVITVPFMYRIHEYGGDDTETSEPGLIDYRRYTPNGLIAELNSQQWEDMWVGRLVKNDVKTFPEFFCPEGVVGWARKRYCHDMLTPAILYGEDSWNPELPADWREQQTHMAQEYERRIADAGKAVEPV